MRIAILGWGSLIWDQQPYPKIKGGWSKGGPLLPIEFSRISESRNGALTLVLDCENGELLPTRYAESDRNTLEDAICDLRVREGTVVRRIGYTNLCDGSERSGILPNTESIRDWANQYKFDAVVWTDLQSNFTNKTDQKFTLSLAMEYIESLTGKAISSAREYINKAPEEIKTPLRCYLLKHSSFLEDT